MNTPLKPPLADSVLAVRPGRLLLVVTPGSEKARITELVAGLALRSTLHIVAGSDWLPGDRLARSLRRRTPQFKPILERIHLARAFTCYQLVDLLAGVPADPHPLLVLDFLHTLYDPDIPLPVRFRVLKHCCEYLERLSRYKPVAVMLRQEPVIDYRYFQPILAAIADEILQVETDGADARQPGLF